MGEPTIASDAIKFVTGAASIEIDGQRVSLNADGLKRLQGDEREVGRKIGAAVRAAVDHASED